uniref:Peptidase S11 D-alanyl-D-alanine carboxypeptidase A N-terminal domain-containing protein n=2 Tax=Paenibacillus polymyxa TaxID=1406 RepID=A0AAE9IDC2_PAEPO
MTENLIKPFMKIVRKPSLSASLTKIMTAVVTLEHVDDLSAIAPVDRRTFGELLASNSSMAGFREDAEVTYQDLLYGKILTSGGGAANSLAVHVAGSVEDFVLMMYDKTTELGLNDTHFTRPEGLHRNRYSTAVQLKDKISFFVKNKFETLENAQIQAENILISELPLTFNATRKVFKTMFKNIYKESISYTDEEGKEIACGFKDALASMMNA